MYFPTTQWSVLAKATLNGETEAHSALDDLCRRYWSPLKQFIRARGYEEAEAADLTQAFLLHLMERSAFRKADHLRGRFRSFLLGALVRFLGDERDRRLAQKRGGQIHHTSLNEAALEAAVPRGDEPAAQAFDRAWAVAVLRSALSRVQQEYANAGQESLFLVLRDFLPGATATPSYEATAARLGISVSAFTSELHRLRLRARTCLREEVAATVSAPHEIEEELAHLQHVLMDRGTDFPDSTESNPPGFLRS